MSSVSDASSAAVSAASTRADLAATFLKSNAQAEQAVAERVEAVSESLNESAKRETRKIPGLGNAVDISV